MRADGKAEIGDRLAEARERTLELIEPLDEGRLNQVYSPLLSPLAWDLGHIANFEELWLVQTIGGREPVPRLDELLGSYPDLRVNIDVKAPSAVGPLVDAVRRAGAVDRVCIGSFHDRLIPLVRFRLGERLCTSLGPREVLALRLGTLRRTAAGCAQVPPGLLRIRVIDARLIAAAHQRGLPVHAWTVNDPAEMNRLLDLGVDGIMSDDAPALRDVLVARRAWTA